MLLCIICFRASCGATNKLAVELELPQEAVKTFRALALPVPAYRPFQYLFPQSTPLHYNNLIRL